MQLDEQNVVALFREIREEAKNINEFVTAVVKASSKNPPDVALIKSYKQQAGETFTTNAKEIAQRLEELKGCLAASPALRDDYGDVETRARNIWDRVKREWGRRNQGQAYVALRDQLNELVLEAAYVTIPPRLEYNLGGIRIGGALDFDREFEDEVPDKALRNKVLEWIRSHAADVSGVVDVSRSVVYKAHPSSWVRAGTVTALLALAALGVLAPYLRSELDLDGVIAPAIKAEGNLARACLLGLLGLVLHVFIAGWKEMQQAVREGKEPPTLGNWFLWLHVRYLPASAAVIWVIAAVLATAHATKKTDAITMIAVGYSADSLADLALPKLQSLMTRRTEAVRKAIG